MTNQKLITQRETMLNARSTCMMILFLLPIVQPFSIEPFSPAIHQPYRSTKADHTPRTRSTRLSYQNDDFSFNETPFGYERPLKNRRHGTTKANTKVWSLLDHDKSGKERECLSSASGAVGESRVCHQGFIEIDCEIKEERRDFEKRPRHKIDSRAHGMYDGKLSGLRGISISLADTYKEYPLVIEPNTSIEKCAASFPFLRQFVQQQRDWLELQLVKHGALILRGFDVEQNSKSGLRSKSQARGEELVRAFDPDYSGRSFSENGLFDLKDGVEYYIVTKPTGPTEFFPSSVGLEEIGAQTGITDFRKIHGDLPPKLRSKLKTKKLLYRRIDQKPVLTRKGSGYGPKKQQFEPTNEDPIQFVESPCSLFGKTSTQICDHTLRRVMEKVMNELNNRSVVSEFVSDAFRAHPITKDPIWFPFVHWFHWTSAPAEAFEQFRRTRDWKMLPRAFQLALQSLWKKVARKQIITPVEVSFGDRTAISIHEMHQIRRVIRQNSRYDVLQAGDILMIDSVTTGLQL